MISSRFLAVLGLVVGLYAGYIPSASAAECQYDVHAVPVYTGVVSRIIGDGVLFTDGRAVIMPESLLPFMRLDKEAKLHGLISTDGQKIWALALYDGDKLVCPSALDVRKGAYPGSPAYDVIDHKAAEAP